MEPAGSAPADSRCS